MIKRISILKDTLLLTNIDLFCHKSTNSFNSESSSYLEKRFCDLCQKCLCSVWRLDLVSKLSITNTFEFNIIQARNSTTNISFRDSSVNGKNKMFSTNLLFHISSCILNTQFKITLKNLLNELNQSKINK